MITPTVAAITLDQSGGGIAAVSRLLWRVFEEHWERRARLLTVFDGENHPATVPEKARFALTLAGAQVLNRTDWIFFSHLGLAQIQNGVPTRLRRPYGVFLHGIEAWKPLSRGEEYALIGADIRVANSRHTADRVMDMHPGVGPVDVCPLAHLPVESGRTRRVIPPDLPDLGPHAVLVVGRMIRSERYKGHDQLIDAWPRVIASVPDARLVIAGDGDDARRLRQRAASSQAARSIVFTGFVPGPMLDDLYRRAALFALPSRGEGFGLVYLEAMFHGLPCLGSIHDAAGEVIVDGQTGCLVDQSDIAGLAQTVAALLSDSALRRRMGNAGLVRLQSEFSFERFRRRIRELLRVDQPGDAAGRPV